MAINDLKAAKSVRFFVYRSGKPPIDEQKFPLVALFRDNWDDYSYKTLFIAHLYVSAEESIRLGPVKIAIDEKAYRPEYPAGYDKLPESAFSLGQSVSYYRALRRLPPRFRRMLLRAMGDLVAFPKLFEKRKDSDVVQTSLLRSGSARHALRRGGYYIGSKTEEVEPPRFRLRMKVPGAAGPHVVDIDQTAPDGVPRRVTLLIGKNGTGKTTTLATLAYALSPGPSVFQADSLQGVVTSAKIEPLEAGSNDPQAAISQIIAVTYNAFDDFPLPHAQAASLGTYRSRLTYKYCGLRNMDGDLDTGQIPTMWGKALEPIEENERTDILHANLAKFLGEELATVLSTGDESSRRQCFRKLSAGQRILVSIFADIIATIEEGSLLLIDEPETHLHPGLLSSAFLALVELLNEFDSHAIISTHSPILLQNIPAKFVRIFKRIDGKPVISEPRFETFGEDLGELYRDLFGLSDLERDYTSVLQDLLDEHGSVSAVEALFGAGLGLAAKAFLISQEQESF
ncbi:AAA family ATPase [Phenylobacterium sp.]|uniref:AAA family ATPase n=1 Tax=Phenylobacterium sp. TaxID=1871053 RepID=UPI00261750C7|nr:AAA family ATPase [Phenylobacterium sp.]